MTSRSPSNKRIPQPACQPAQHPGPDQPQDPAGRHSDAGLRDDRNPLPGPRARPAVNRALTSRRRPRVSENDEYAAFARRILRAWARWVGAGDIDAITDMAAAVRELDDAIREAVAGLRRKHYSWAEIAARLGVTRQAAQQRWGGSRRS